MFPARKDWRLWARFFTIDEYEIVSSQWWPVWERYRRTIRRYQRESWRWSFGKRSYVSLCRVIKLSGHHFFQYGAFRGKPKIRRTSESRSDQQSGMLKFNLSISNIFFIFLKITFLLQKMIYIKKTMEGIVRSLNPSPKFLYRNYPATWRIFYQLYLHMKYGQGKLHFWIIILVLPTTLMVVLLNWKHKFESIHIFSIFWICNIRLISQKFILDQQVDFKDFHDLVNRLAETNVPVNEAIKDTTKGLNDDDEEEMFSYLKNTS